MSQELKLQDYKVERAFIDIYSESKILFSKNFLFEFYLLVKSNIIYCLFQISTEVKLAVNLKQFRPSKRISFEASAIINRK